MPKVRISNKTLDNHKDIGDEKVKHVIFSFMTSLSKNSTRKYVNTTVNNLGKIHVHGNVKIKITKRKMNKIKKVVYSNVYYSANYLLF